MTIDRYTLTTLDGITERFGALPADARPRFNIAPMQHALIYSERGSTRGLANARWGLLPPWRGHGGKRDPHVMRTAVDGIARIPHLRNAFKTQRCLVLADGVLAWNRAGKKPPAWWLHPAAERPDARTQLVGLAAIAASHREDHQLSFAWIIGPAPTLSEPLPQDLALELPIAIAPADYARWLTGSPDDATAVLSASAPSWRVEPVSAHAKSIEHDDPACIEPLRNPLQGQLF